MTWNDYKRAKSLASRRAYRAEHAGQVLPKIQELQAQGLSLRQIAEALSAADIAPPRSGWSHKAVKRILDRAAEGYVEVPAADAMICPNPTCGAQMFPSGSHRGTAICLYCEERHEIATL